MTDLLNPDLVEALALALLHSLWQGAFIIALVLLIDNSGIISDARHRHVLYYIALLALGLSFVWTFLALFDITEAAGTSDSARTLYGPVRDFHTSSRSAPGAVGWRFLTVILWAGGALCFALFNLFGGMKLYAIRRNCLQLQGAWQTKTEELSRRIGLTRIPTLLRSNEMIVPCVLGVLRPVIVFPSIYFLRLSTEELEAILLHELAHIKRKDFLMNLAQIAVECLLFHNPATWWLARRIRAYREFSCDDIVQLNTSDNKTYLEALYTAAQLSANPPVAAIGLFHNHSELIMRIKRMLSNERPGRSMRSLLVAGAVALGTMAIFAFTASKKHERLPDIVAGQIESTINHVAFSGHRLIQTELDPGVLVRPLAPIQLVLRQPNPLEELEQPEVISTIARVDTHPPTPRMQQLEVQMEMLASEMEELADQLDEIMHEQIDPQVDQIDELAEKIDAIIEEREAVWESQFENSQEMLRMEELNDLIDERMDALEEVLEESIDEEIVENLEEQIELLEDQYEELESLSPEDRRKLNEEMSALTTKLNAEMEVFNAKHRELVNDLELKELQVEMEQLGVLLQEKYGEGFEIHSEELEALHREMMSLQKELELQMKNSMQEIEEMFRVKNEEMQRLHDEYSEEYKNWEQQHDKNE